MTDKMTKELNKFVDFVCQNRHKIEYFNLYLNCHVSQHLCCIAEENINIYTGITYIS